MDWVRQLNHAVGGGSPKVEDKGWLSSITYLELGQCRWYWSCISDGCFDGILQLSIIDGRCQILWVGSSWQTLHLSEYEHGKWLELWGVIFHYLIKYLDCCLLVLDNQTPLDFECVSVEHVNGHWWIGNGLCPFGCGSVLIMLDQSWSICANYHHSVCLE